MFAENRFNLSQRAPKWLFGKCLSHLNARSQRGDAHEETTEVRPIPLSVATCQTEQIEFVFLRCLVGALNSILVALLIKAVKANLFGGEPRRHGSECSCHCTYVNGCQR